MHVVRVLHISDLHEGKPGSETLWRRRRVLGEAWRRNFAEIRADGRPIHLVCFTGDVAYSGRPDQYTRAAHFVSELLEQLGVGLDRFFTVPGGPDARGRPATLAGPAGTRRRAGFDPGSNPARTAF